MARLLLLLLLVLAACAKAPEADLASVSEARSLAAEWALVNEQAGQHKLTNQYIGSMHKWLRQELQSSANALTQPNSLYGVEIGALLREPDDAAPAELRARSDRLKQIEDKLESD